MKALIVAMALIAGSAHAVEPIAWDKTVIELELIVGVEQLVHFDGAGTVGLSSLLADRSVFRHLFASNTAYWKALQPFDAQRVKMKLATGVVLFDVSAKSVKQPPKAVEPLKVIMQTEPEIEPDRKPIAAANMFDLIRYASQIDHAPARVVKPVPGIHEVESTDSELSVLYRDPYSNALDMFVRHAWSVDGLYVTAIAIRNRSHMTLHINPARFQHSAHSEVNGINNRFIASAMVRRIVEPRGSERDSTMLYVVTHRPFSETIKLGASQ